MYNIVYLMFGGLRFYNPLGYDHYDFTAHLLISFVVNLLWYSFLRNPEGKKVRLFIFFSFRFSSSLNCVCSL